MANSSNTFHKWLLETLHENELVLDLKNIALKNELQNSLQALNDFLVDDWFSSEEGTSIADQVEINLDKQRENHLQKDFPLFIAGNLELTVSKSTKNKGYQVTTFNHTGALSDHQENSLKGCLKYLKELNAYPLDKHLSSYFSQEGSIAMANQYKKISEAEKKKEIDQLTEKMTTQVQTYTETPEQMTELLDFMSQFRDYSIRNQFMIRSQHKGANGVASYQRFKELGFPVQKGEKGIKIWVPMTVTQFKTKDGEWKNQTKATIEEKEWIKKNQSTDNVKTFTRFKLGTVFDVTQTHAKPEDYPAIFPNKKNQFDFGGKDLDLLNQSLLEYSNSTNIPIIKEPFRDSAAKGYYMPSTHSITLNTKNTETENVHTLIHELAHAEMHNSSKLKNKELTMQAAPVLEYQAEMTAYVVGKYYGLDTEKHSLRYISNWTNNLEKVEDKINSLSEVKTVSGKLIDQIDLIIEQTTERKQGLSPDKDEVIATKLGFLTDQNNQNQYNQLKDTTLKINTIQLLKNNPNDKLTLYSIELVSKEQTFDYVMATGKNKKEIATTWVGEKTADEWLKEDVKYRVLDKDLNQELNTEKIKDLIKLAENEKVPMNIFSTQFNTDTKKVSSPSL